MKKGEITEVKHYKDKKWTKRIFLSKLNENNYVCVAAGHELAYKSKLPIDVTSWRYCNEDNKSIGITIKEELWKRLLDIF